MALSGKQKHVLRGIGQLLDPLVHVGKEGIREEAIAATEDVFRRRELIKVRVLKTAPEETRAIAAQLAEATHSEVAGRVGFTFLLYRANPQLKHRIELPPAKSDETIA
jgi:RNA-binding protein